MTFVIKDRVRESTTTTGTGAFALGGAVSAAYRAFSSVMVNGDTTWYACVLPGGAWEVGIGTWVTGNTLQRTTILDSSNSGSIVTFGAGTKDVFIALPASKGNAQNNAFVPGTLTMFQQTSAPTYWTKQVTHNDKSLRVVSGTASSGGTTPFSNSFNTVINVSNTTITTTTMASHTHPYAVGADCQVCADHIVRDAQTLALSGSNNTSSTGGDNPHTHNFNMSVQYVDIIIASKDT